MFCRGRAAVWASVGGTALEAWLLAALGGGHTGEAPQGARLWTARLSCTGPGLTAKQDWAARPAFWEPF